MVPEISQICYDTTHLTALQKDLQVRVVAELAYDRGLCKLFFMLLRSSDSK
jgi:hypothetical protein